MSNIKNKYCHFRFKKKRKKFQKHKKCSYFNNFSRMWLVNEPNITFSAPINYAKAQFNPIFLSRAAVSTDAVYTQTSTFVKMVFSASGLQFTIFK